MVKTKEHDYDLIEFNSNLLPIPFGLYNNDVLCYFNSLIQCLLSCTCISEYVLLNEDKIRENKFLWIYTQLLKKYLNVEETNKEKYKGIEKINLLLFNEFSILLKNKNIEFGYSQEDCGELLILLLDMINDDYIYNLFYSKYQCDIYCKNCKHITSIKHDINIEFEIDVDNITRFYLNSEVDKNLSDLNKFIRNNYSNCDGYICKACNKNNIIKINRLKLIPTIITIVFNKYTEKKYFKYESELSFIDKIKNVKHNYILISSIHHDGNMNYGHYFIKTYRNDYEKKKNCIFEINDSIFEKSTFEPINNTYILFYHYNNTVPYY